MIFGLALYVVGATFAWPALAVLVVRATARRGASLRGRGSRVRAEIADDVQRLLTSSFGTSWSVAASTFVYYLLHQVWCVLSAPSCRI